MRNTYFVLILSLLIGGAVETASADLIVRGNENAPIYVSDKDSGRFDFSNDGLNDYYVKAHYTGNEKQQYKVDYKIQDECVDGNTFDSATMKLGFTQKEDDFRNRIWLTENIEVWNPWFRSAQSTDANHQIDLVSLSPGTLPIPYPASGDDAIQGNAKNMIGSFVHRDSIKELDNQPGWEGAIFFNVPAGEYYLWTIHPATGIEGCDRLRPLAFQ